MASSVPESGGERPQPLPGSESPAPDPAGGEPEPPNAGVAAPEWRPPGTAAGGRREVPAPPPPRGSTTGQTTGLRTATRRTAEGGTAGHAAEVPEEAPPKRGPRPLRRPGDPRPLRYRVLPRSAIGISIAILFFAFGASLSGVVLYSYYEYRLTQNEDKVTALTNGLPTAVNKASASLKAQESTALAQINAQLAPLKSVLATGQTVQDLAAKVAPALYFVHTQDQAGQPSVGTAFAVASDNRQTLLLTSYTVVAAATRQPGPQVFVRHGGNDQVLSVYTWDETKDLALLILPTGNQPTVPFATQPPQTGERVFAVSALGAQGASITQGFVADVSADGIQHDATTGLQFQGGPLLNSDGQAVAILSRTYAPLGFPVADVWFAVPPSAACAKVLTCSNGALSGAAPGAAAGP